MSRIEGMDGGGSLCHIGYGIVRSKITVSPGVPTLEHVVEGLARIAGVQFVATP